MKGGLLSGIFLVAGTSVGAAMLALPITAVKLGLIFTCLYLLLIAIIMAGAALLLIPLYRQNGPLSISSLAKNSLGENWARASSFAILILLYSLLVAYLAGISDTLTSSLTLSWHSSLIMITLLFFISLALSDQLINFYNKLAFSIKILVFCGIFLILVKSFEYEILAANLKLESEGFLTSLPIFITSFGFHSSAPFLFKKFGEKNYRKSVILGTTVTLLLYLSWIILIFGLIAKEKIVSNSLEEFLSILNQTIVNPLLLQGLKIFYNLAIITSLFGVSIGLMDFLGEKLRNQNRLLLSGLVFFPPMLFNFLNKNLFLQALTFAGIVLTFLALFIPTILAWKNKVINKVLLILLMIFSLLVISGEMIAFLKY
jgi:tyrosine-specific transport protein